MIEYLSKEDKEGLKYITDEKLEEFKNFFDKDNQLHNQFEAQKIIDEHSRGLKKDDAKFFMLSINPSQRELKHLEKIAIEQAKQESNKTGQTVNFNDILNQKLMEYTNNCMNEYAKCFNRELNGKPLTVDNLNYVARIENKRTYKWNDKDVQHNKEVRKGKEAEYIRNSKGEIIKEGMKKEGTQKHIHVVVSRFDTSKKMSLSPCSNSKGNSDEMQLNGKEVKIGFDRNEFSKNCEKAFDKQFEFSRSYENSTKYKLDKLQQSNETVRGKLVSREGDINALDLMEKYAKFSKEMITNPKDIINNIKNISLDQMKALTIPELNNNPIIQAKRELDIKAKVVGKIKEAITTGGMEL